MAVLVGLDLAPVPRIASAVERWGERFLDRLFVPGELRTTRAHPRAFAEHVAGRFAAKEAAMKALGTGWRGIAFREIRVWRDASGKPVLDLTGRAGELARRLRVRATEVSITHTAEVAAAVVLLVTEDGD